MQNKYAKLKVVSNPIVNQSLCTIRAKDTDTQGVRLAARKLTRILLYEATKNLPQKDVEVETPIAKFVPLGIFLYPGTNFCTPYR